MSAALEGLAAARTALEMILDATTEETVRRLATRAIASLEAIAKAELARKVAEAERKRRERAERKSLAPPASADVRGRPGASADVQGRPGTWGEGGQTINGSTERASRSLVSASPDPERESARPRTSEDTASADVQGRRNADPVVEVRLDLPLSEELRAIAQMATVQDVEGSWLKFCGHHVGKRWTPQELGGAWQKWSVDERTRERTARDRRPSTTGRPAPVEYEGNPNPVTRRFELHPLEQARLDALAADRDQAARAAAAERRPPGDPKRAFGGGR